MKISIDDFKPGATAYVMGYGEGGWIVKECVILETHADKINRPPHYQPFVIVTVQGKTRKCHYDKSPNSPHFYSLTGFSDSGAERVEDWEWPLLFPSMEAVTDYQEVHAMQMEAAHKLATLSIMRMGNDKLRALLDVLDGSEIIW